MGQYSREHTQCGHSEYQEAMVKEFDEKGIAIQMMNVGTTAVTVIANPENGTAVSIVHEGQSGGDFDGFCEVMNNFLGRAYMFHFGTDFDGPVE